MIHRTKGQMAHGFLLTQAICDVCHRKRSTGTHARCSKIRQAKYQGAHSERP